MITFTIRLDRDSTEAVFAALALAGLVASAPPGTSPNYTTPAELAGQARVLAAALAELFRAGHGRAPEAG